MLALLTSCDIIKSDDTSSTSSTVSSETSTPVDTSIPESIDEPIVLAQGFVEYDESYLGETENTVLFFHQESCGTCKTAEANLIETGAGGDLMVLKVDFDASENDELRQKYGVTMKHTFVQVDADGEMIKKWSGSMSADDIMEQVSGEKMMKEEWEDAMMEENSETMEEGDEKMMEKQDVMEDKTTEETVMETKELAWVYAEYDSSLVGNNESTVLAFFAPWCPSCVAADKSISGADVPEGLSILKVDFDSATDLRKKYGVTSQHTFVQVDADGNLIKKWAGWTSVDDVVERVQ